MAWNEQTGILVSGHQKLNIADEVNKYEAGKNDYEIKVEVINVDLKKEKELNIFFNSKAVQGEMDYKKLAQIFPDIDADLAGLDVSQSRYWFFYGGLVIIITNGICVRYIHHVS